MVNHPEQLPGAVISAAARKKQDKFTLYYAMWGSLCIPPFFALAIVDDIYDLYFAIIPYLLLIALPFVFFLLYCFVSCLWRRAWRRTLSVAAAPFLVFGVNLILNIIGVTPDAAHFALTQRYYSAAIEKISERPRFQKFVFSETGGAAVTQVSKTLIFDETDGIASGAQVLTPALQKQVCRVCRIDVRDYNIGLRPLWSHFYLVTETY